MAKAQALTYTNRYGVELDAVEFHPEDLPESNGLAARPAPDGTKHLQVTLADGRTASRIAVPAGEGPGTYRVGAPSKEQAAPPAAPEPEAEQPPQEPEAATEPATEPEQQTETEPAAPATTEPEAEAAGQEG